MEPTSGSSPSAATPAPEDVDELVIDLRDHATVDGNAAPPDDMWVAEYLTPEFLRGAIASLRHEYGDPEQRFGVYFVDGLDPRSSLGRAVELERFGESFDNDVDLMRELYGRFEQVGATELICVVDHEAEVPAGVIRTVRNTLEAGCRILNDLQHDGENGWGLSWGEIIDRSSFAAERPEEIIDIPTIAVSKAYQGARQADSVSKALMAAVFRRALGSDAHTWVCSLERVPYILIQAATENVMHEFEGVEGRPYYGAPDTVPLWANFREYEAYLRRDHPDTMAWLMGRTSHLDQYFFAFPGGEPTWDELDAEVIDLRMYEPVVPESR